MEKLAGLWLQAVLLLAALGSTLSEEKVLKVGDVLVLRPPKSGPFTNVLWKHNGNLVAEWTQGGGDVDYFGSFKGRAILDPATGQLTISDVKETDSGAYTVELSNTVQDERYDVKVFTVLPKPEIWVRPVSCTPALGACTLSCAAKTEGAGSVTYSWRKDGGEWKVLEKDLNITKTEDGHVQKFTCKMKNLVSEEESESLTNPLYEPLDIGAIVGGVLGSLAVLVVGGVVIWKREDIKKLLTSGYGAASQDAKENELYETGAPNSSASPAAAEQPKPSTDPENGNAT